MLDSGKVGRYSIAEKIGSGGMGEVYLAEDSRLNRQIALKTLPSDVASDSERMRRFMHEAKTASALNHPNIVTIYEINDEDETPYIAMEYVKGETLAKAIKSRSLTIAEIIDIAIQVAGALAAAHEAGIVHRDIKPDNIIRRPDGLVKVLDFGLAKLTENDGSHDPEAETVALRTNPGMILGTASYMSPEQARGKVIDGRSDIFSFGIVLYNMLAGRPPFRGETYVDVIASLIHNEPQPLTEIAEDVPPELDVLVRKCLRKDREERFQTARELAADLADLRRTLDLDVSGRRANFSSDPNINVRTFSGHGRANTSLAPTGVATSSISRIIAEEVKLHPVRAIAASMMVIVALGAISFGISKLWPTRTQALDSLRFTRLTNSGNLETHLSALSPEGELVAYVASDKGTRSLWLRQTAAEQPIQVLPPADVSYGGVAFSPDGGKIFYSMLDADGTSGLYQIPVFGGEPRRIASGADSEIAVSPDGTKLAFNNGSMKLMTVGANGGEPSLLFSSANGERLNALSWSPNGNSIAVAYYSSVDSRDRLGLVNVSTGEMTPLHEQRWLRLSGVAWRSDGTGMYISGRDLEANRSQIWFVEYPSGEVSRITNDLNTYVGVSVSRDGRSLVAIQESRSTSIYELLPGSLEQKRITSSLGTEDGIAGVTWAPDGRIVYTVRSNGIPDLWITSRDGSSSRQLTVESGSNYEPRVSPDGRHIVFSSNRLDGFKIWRMDINGENQVRLTTPPGIHTVGEYSPDGRWVYFNSLLDDDSCTVWRVPAEGGTPERLAADQDACRPKLSPDGKSLLFVSGYGRPDAPYRFVVYPVNGNAPERVLDLPAIAKRRVFEWSPDGKAIIYVDRQNNVDNLWRQPLEGGPPEQLTNFDRDWIYRFAIAPDGGIALSRGNEATDAVLIQASF